MGIFNEFPDKNIENDDIEGDYENEENNMIIEKTPKENKQNVNFMKFNCFEKKTKYFTFSKKNN